MNTSEIRFVFDINVQAWTVNVNGTSYSAGIVADSGGAVTAGTEITAIVDWTEGLSEGQNRINIYGQSIDGLWTPYQT